jgi:UDP-glucose 4-epimerase
MTAPLILLTGATGFIASHTWLALREAGMRVVGIDDFSNSSPEVLKRLRTISGEEPNFVQADVCNADALQAVFEREPVAAVVHFAAFKAVGESVAKPLAYYANNIGALTTLARVMERNGCKTLVFSSSATVYGKPERLPIREDAPLSSTNPYGASKLIGENILRDVLSADPTWAIALLRYFNPVGAHESGLIGETPNGIPNNLVPYIAQVASGERTRYRLRDRRAAAGRHRCLLRRPDARRRTFGMARAARPGDRPRQDPRQAGDRVWHLYLQSGNGPG